METLFEKFQRIPAFLFNAWNNFIEIACIEEKKNTNTDEISTEMPNKFAKFLSKEYQVLLKSDFNEEIQRGLKEIKLKMLSYTPKIFAFFLQLSIFSKKIINSNLDLFKLLLIYTNNDEIFLETCEYLEVFKKKFIFAFNNICIYDAEIEQILMDKKSILLKSHAKSSRISLKILQNLQDSPGVSPMNPLDFSLGNERKSTVKSPFLILQRNSQVNFMETNNNIENKEKEGDKSMEDMKLDDDPIEKEKQIKKKLIEELDKWLCFDGFLFIFLLFNNKPCRNQRYFSQ